ncbi:MAG TPA: serine hydrolase [Candidatus Sulfotelmatobacter sp.]|nr:serine hydrolase [Candidatus Sulfotelmatobacter sp.]
MRRADFLAFTGATLAGPSSTRPPFARASDADPFVALEKHGGGRLGVAALDLGSAARLAHRGAERFPLGGLWRLPLVMTALARVDAGDDKLERQIAFGPSDLEGGASALARRYPAGGVLTLGKLCAYAIVYGDDTAADLLAPLIGGPAAITAYLRTIGVRGIRVDRLARRRPLHVDVHDERDSATPDSTAHLLEQLGSESPLSDESTTLLITWMRATVNSRAQLRAGVPAGWTVSDVSGGAVNLAADAGLLTPSAGASLAVVCFALDFDGVGDANAAIAACARTVTARFARTMPASGR